MFSAVPLETTQAHVDSLIRSEGGGETQNTLILVYFGEWGGWGEGSSGRFMDASHLQKNDLINENVLGLTPKWNTRSYLFMPFQSASS